MRRILPLFLLVLAAGCSGGQSLSKQDDDQLRHNFTRKLTPEEIAKLGGGKPSGAPAKDK